MKHSIVSIVFVVTLILLIKPLSKKFKLSFPVVLIIIGIIISLIVKQPLLTIQSDVIFMLFLPPLLYEASQEISWHEFKRWRYPIISLSFGLVVCSILCVAVFACWVIPGLPFALGVLIGAIIAPPDAIASTSILRPLGVSGSVATILEGESLINDASSLIAYKYALILMFSGSLKYHQLVYSFAEIAIGGVFCGLVIALITRVILKRFKDAMTITLLTLIMPVGIYIIAEEFHVSGVLAVVSYGLYFSWHRNSFTTHESRLQTREFWKVFSFLLTGMIFILIGMQLRVIIRSFTALELFATLIHGVLICMLLIFVRIIWVASLTLLTRRIRLRMYPDNELDKHLIHNIIIVSWSGMRGVVTLAAALAIPATLPNGAVFPFRNEILLIAFIVILMTLLLHSSTLPVIVRRIRVKQQDCLQNNSPLELSEDVVSATVKHLDGIAYKYPKILIDKIKKDIVVLSHNSDEKSIGNEILELNLRKSVIQFQQEYLRKIYVKNLYSHEAIRKVENDLDNVMLFLETRWRYLQQKNPTND